MLEDGKMSNNSRAAAPQTEDADLVLALLFIKKTCKKLGLRLAATCTAQILYHRFFARQSKKEHDPLDIAITCVFVATKVEENWKNLEEVVEAARTVVQREKPDPLSQDAMNARQQTILRNERVVLNTLSFDVSVEHPHKYVDRFVKLVTTGQPREYRELLQASWNISNDCLSTDLCLKYHPRLIAASAVSLAVKLLRSRSVYVSVKPRFVEIVAKFEKQGEIFGHGLSEIKIVEEELLSFYEKDSVTPGPRESIPNLVKAQ